MSLLDEMVVDPYATSLFQIGGFSSVLHYSVVWCQTPTMSNWWWSRHISFINLRIPTGVLSSPLSPYHTWWWRTIFYLQEMFVFERSFFFMCEHVGFCVRPHWMRGPCALKDCGTLISGWTSLRDYPVLWNTQCCKMHSTMPDLRAHNSLLWEVIHPIAYAQIDEKTLAFCCGVLGKNMWNMVEGRNDHSTVTCFILTKNSNLWLFTGGFIFLSLEWPRYKQA